MDMLQEFINGQRFIDFSIGEYRWNSMLTFIEQMMMIANKANEMPNVRLSERLEFAKMISKKISLIKCKHNTFGWPTSFQ